MKTNHFFPDTHLSSLIDTTIGPLWFVASPTALLVCHTSPLLAANTTLYDSASAATLTPQLQRAAALIHQAESQLQQYFEGRLKTFTLPLQLPEASPFRSRVWNIIKEIPYGRTIPYNAIAGCNATRAAASAVVANPLTIFIPCHRVIHADGSPGKYSSGADAKKLLLTLESTGQL